MVGFTFRSVKSPVGALGAHASRVILSASNRTASLPDSPPAPGRKPGRESLAQVT